MSARQLVSLGASIAAIATLTACGDNADRDLCTQYDQLVSAANEIEQQDPLTTKAADLRAASESFQDELDQFQAVSEGRLDTAISTLRADLDAYRQAAVEAGQQALETAQPLFEDIQDDIAEAWGHLQQLAEQECPQS